MSGVVLVSRVGLVIFCGFEVVRLSTTFCTSSLWRLCSALTWRSCLLCTTSGLVLQTAKRMVASSCASAAVVVFAVVGAPPVAEAGHLLGAVSSYSHPGERKGD